jgi:hypothetical protein
MGVAANDARVQNAIMYIQERWNVATPPGKTGQSFLCSFSLWNKGCGYGVFNIFKGFRLYAINTITVNALPLDWYKDMVDDLLVRQKSPTSATGGQWDTTGAAGVSMGFSCCDNDTNGITALAELILSPVALVLPSSLVLTPPTASNPVGTNHTVTATATAVGGAPVAAANVTFTVISGPNAGKTGQAVTNAQGKASFTYHDDAGVVGTDNIRANIGNLQSNIAVKNWVLGPPDLVVSIGNLSKAGGIMKVELKLRNNGGLVAKDVKITTVNRITVPVTYSGPALPISKGDLAAGATTSQDLDFNLNGVAAGATVRFSVAGTFKDANGKSYLFSSNRLVRVP